MGRVTVQEARAALTRALATGRVVVSGHAMRDKGGLRTFSEPEIRAELKVAAASGEVAHDHHGRGRFLAYGIELALVFEVQAPDVVVITAFLQGG
jgi:hypothetical protein